MPSGDQLYEAEPTNPQLIRPYAPPLMDTPGGASGELVREGALSAVPTGAGVAAFPVGFGIGASVGAPGGPLALATGLIGGTIASLGAGYGASRAQQWAIDQMPIETQRWLTVDAETRARGMELHPTAGFIGGVAPQLMFMRPGWNGAKAALAAGAIGGGAEAGSEIAETGHVDPYRVIAQTVLGSALGRNTRLGNIVMRPGERLAASIPTGAGRTAEAMTAEDTVGAARRDGIPPEHFTAEEHAAASTLDDETFVRESNPHGATPAAAAMHGEQLAAATVAAARGDPSPPIRQPPAPALDRDSVIDFVIDRLEGGGRRVVDSGGPTRFGISGDAHPGVDIDHMSRGDAARIYREQYWDKMHLDGLDPGLAAVAFDAAVNHGPERAREMLAQSGGDPARLIELRRAEYARLIAENPGKYGKYAHGWANRLSALEEMVAGDGRAVMARPRFDNPEEMAFPLEEEAPQPVKDVGDFADRLAAGRHDDPELPAFARENGAGIMAELGSRAEAVTAAPEVRAGPLPDPGAPPPPASAEDYVDRYLAGEGRDGGTAARDLEQFAANHGPAIEAEFARRFEAGDFKPFSAQRSASGGFGGEAPATPIAAQRAQDGVAFEPMDHVDRLQRYAADREGPLDATAVGHALGIEPKQARRAMAAAMAQDGGHGRATGGRDAGPPDHETLKQFDGRDSAGIDLQNDSIEHDLRMAIEADPSLTVRLDAEGDVMNVADLLAGFDDEARGLDALRSCLKPGKAA